MEKIREIPEGLIHKFDNNKYLMKRKVYAKKTGGIKRQQVKTELIYVFEFNDDGKIEKATFGILVDKPKTNSINNEFLIITYGSEEPVEFKMTIPLIPTGFKESYKVVKEIGEYLADPDKYLNKNGSKSHK